MRLKIQGKEYVIRFHHDVLDKFTQAALHEYILENEGTEAEDYYVVEEPIFIGEAFCHYKDNYKKATGRKIALARLLEWMSKNRFDLSEDERREIWSKYFETHNK